MMENSDGEMSEIGTKQTLFGRAPKRPLQGDKQPLFSAYDFGCI
jgi:hypothetical protein